MLWAESILMFIEQFIEVEMICIWHCFECEMGLKACERFRRLVLR